MLISTEQYLNTIYYILLNNPYINKKEDVVNQLNKSIASVINGSTFSSTMGFTVMDIDGDIEILVDPALNRHASYIDYEDFKKEFIDG